MDLPVSVPNASFGTSWFLGTGALVVSTGSRFEGRDWRKRIYFMRMALVVSPFVWSLIWVHIDVKVFSNFFGELMLFEWETEEIQPSESRHQNMENFEKKIRHWFQVCWRRVPTHHICERCDSFYVLLPSSSFSTTCNVMVVISISVESFKERDDAFFASWSERDVDAVVLEDKKVKRYSEQNTTLIGETCWWFVEF